MAGLIGFVFSSFLCSLAPSILLLIILRAIQGFTAAMILSVSLGLVKKSFPKSMLIAGGLTLSHAIGGILDGILGWRSIFLINCQREF
jgi:MFS family permease